MRRLGSLAVLSAVVLMLVCPAWAAPRGQITGKVIYYDEMPLSCEGEYCAYPLYQRIPLAGAKVAARSSPGSVARKVSITNQGGIYRLTLRPGRYLVGIEGDFPQWIRVRRGKIVKVDFTLTAK